MINLMYSQQANAAAKAHPKIRAKLETGWQLSGLYEYQDLDRNPIYWKIRLDPPMGSGEEKWIRPFHFNGKDYLFKEPSSLNHKKLLYRLPDIIKHPDKRKWIVEGEACADQLAKLGLIVTTSGSASSAARADWQPLAGQSIVIWPDNDAAGMQYAEAVTKELLNLGSSVQWVDIQQLNLPNKGDVADWLRNNPNATGIDIENLPLIDPRPIAKHWPEAKPLQRELPPANPFPLDALGDILKPLAQKMVTIIQAPLAICGQSLLAAATLAVQGHADICIDGRVSPISSFFLTVAYSGERKSAVDKVALLPHRYYQALLREKYELGYKDWQRKSAAFESAKKTALSKKENQTFEAKQRVLETLGDPPVPPLEPLILLEEPTYEGLVRLYSQGQPSLGLFSDEGARFIGGNGMNHDNLIKTVAGLSSLWDGQPITRVRAGDGSVILPGRRLSLHLMLQPSIAQVMLSNPVLLDQGILSRCLTAWPDSTVGTRFYQEIDLSQSKEFKEYEACLLAILKSSFPLAENKRNELKPRNLTFSPEAKRQWISFHDAIEEQLANNGQFASIRGLASKAPEHAARLAAILALVRNLHCSSIELEEIHCGIMLVQYYLHEALRIFNAGLIDPDLTLAEKLYGWLKTKGKSEITLVEIYQYGLNEIRNAQKAKVIMSILEEHGWVIPLPQGAIFNNALRKDAWKVRL